jgi:TPP-dependent pyruvate/acetoin dehydrogenase alpha subunit
MAQAPPTKRRKKTGSPGAQTLERMLYFLKLTREAETRIEHVLYRQGKIVGGVYVGRGQEAIGVGSAIQLLDGDVVLPSHRDFSSFLIRGFSLGEILCNWMARTNGPSRGRDNTIHIGDMGRNIIPIISHLGDTCPVACGVGMVLKWRNNGNVALVHFGEGTTSRGDVHEAMNMAAVMKLPVIFVCNNNAYAYSTPTDRQYAVKDLAVRGAAYGMPGVKVDGNDVLAVYSTVEKTIQRARSGGGPSFIECKTFRMTGHSAHDAAEYVPEKLFAQWKKKDPIARLEKVVVAKKILSSKQINHLDEEIRKQVDDAVAYAEASPFPEGATAREGVYCDDDCWWKSTPRGIE